MALNAELADRVRRADDLATELQASRQRLARAREVERRRLVMELGHATTDRLAGLRAAVAAARNELDEPDPDPEAAQQALLRARIGLDELLDRFRVIARGVYPAVLRDQGPAAALDEVAADLPRPVRLTGDLGGRLDWEIESGIYYVVAAAAMGLLAGRPGRHRAAGALRAGRRPGAGAHRRPGPGRRRGPAADRAGRRGRAAGRRSAVTSSWSGPGPAGRRRAVACGPGCRTGWSRWWRAASGRS